MFKHRVIRRIIIAVILISVVCLGAFVALGFALEMVPAFALVAPPLAGRVCAGVGAVILSAGRFGSDRFVLRCEMLLTGWF